MEGACKLGGLLRKLIDLYRSTYEVDRVSDVKLSGLIFSLPQAKRFSGALLSESLRLPDTIGASPALEDGEIERNFVSPHLRIADVPLAFHRESFSAQIAAPTPPTSSFQRRSIVTPQAGVNTSLSAHGELMDQLEAYGRILQYQFSDGRVLTGHQVLYHQYSRLVPRHLLPLNVNVRNDLLAKAHYSLGIKRARASWASSAEQVIISALFSGLRALRTAEQEGEEFTLYFTLDENSFRPRQGLKLSFVELREDKWNHWRLSTALPEAHSGVYYGRAHLELNTDDLGSFDGLSQGFHVDVERRKLTFHTLSEQVNRLSTHIVKPPPASLESADGATLMQKAPPKTNLLESKDDGEADDTEAAASAASDGEGNTDGEMTNPNDGSADVVDSDDNENGPLSQDEDQEPKAALILGSDPNFKAPATFAEALATRMPTTSEKSDAQILRKATATRSAIRASYIETAALEPHEAGGISLHLSGHGNIQTSIQEVNDLLKNDHKHLSIHPLSESIDPEHVKPSMNLLGDGSFKFLTRFQIRDEEWEAHGFPQSMTYLLLNLQSGLAATTGLSINQIAHSRKGLKRERDTKILRHLGMAAMIFFEAASFGLGLPLSDGSVIRTERELLDILFLRLGAVLLKGEGWPNQSGTLEGLCSKNVITLIEGFVSQVLKDIEGREISLFLPSGEWKTTGITKSVVMIFHALVSDLAFETSGACFTRARTKYFENFHFGRIHADREDVALRRRTDPATAQRAIHQPIVSERFQAPESSVPPRGQSILNLINRGFELSFDGKQIEEFVASDFRPEFQIRENSGMPGDVSGPGGANGSADSQFESAPAEPGPDGQPVVAAPTDTSPLVNLGAKKIDWFELHPKFFFKGVEITLEQAGKLSRDGMIEFQGKLFRVKHGELPSLKRLAQFWTSIQGHNAGLIRAKRRKTEDTYYHLPRSQTLELLALRSTGVKVQGGPRWNAICEFYDALDRNRTLESMPESFKATLQGYQSQAVRWLLDLFELGLGGILADDMGLGKTVTSLAFLESLRTSDRLHAALVLVPTSLTYNWLSEATRFTPDLPVHIFSSRQPEEMFEFIKRNDHGLVICTYGLLQENNEFFQQIPWNTVIFDEAQNLKNITTKRTTAARKLLANFKVCLTGTPLENHYGEFYSLFDLTVSGALGDLATFREKYVNPERVLREDLDFLKLKTRPLLLRRTKQQVMHQLPPKVETTIKLPFEEEQRKIYRDIATSYNENIRQAISQQGEAKSQLQMLTALLRLRQACSDPSAIPGITYTGEPPKIVTLIEALIEITESGESALVFTQFLATYERIRQHMAKEKITFFDMNGTDSRLAREKKLQGFKDAPGGAVMLMTLKTGGVGLNLTKASYIFHIEPWWNPAVENQATDRAHRMGQEKTVQVYRYLIQDSVEEKIEVLKEVKSRRFDALFSDSENEKDLETNSGALSQQDFEFLLG